MRKREFFSLRPGSLVLDETDRPYLVINTKHGKELTLFDLLEENFLTAKNNADYTGHSFVKEVCKPHERVIESL